ncbi:NAD+ kinase [Natronobacillus azotifigens]|uniref:NAD kinase n=1 Tax=Natronobacillus azotifigens TaxID=472978 RepID=A0A9J6RD33_9BACI|nr:NAD kinase [Natronobacillus azotifigens]MCZ0703204.1 NAD kinase [Natronobacillus azotifigens]
MENFRTIYLHHKKEKQTQEQVDEISTTAKKYGFMLTNEHKQADIIICFGDDGNFLHGVRKTGFRSSCLYVGMSNTDSPGIYTNFSYRNVQSFFSLLKENSFDFVRFPLLEVSINNEPPALCLNETVVRSSIIKTLAIDVYIDNHFFEHYQGDGLIVSTPSGSTGYNKSTKGAVTDPELPCLQLTELAPLTNKSSNSLGSSLILNQNRTLILEIKQDGNDHPIIGLDNEAYSIRNIQSLLVRLSNRSIQTVNNPEFSYWDNITAIFL